MNYKNPLPLSQGSTKLSEISMDTASPLLQSPIHDSALRVTEQLLKITADLLRRQNFFFRSEGKVYWDGSKINLDNSSIANNMVLDILQTENDSQPKVSIKINGNPTASDSTSFKSITLEDGALIYLELDPAVVAAAGTTLIIENAIDGGSVISGKTLRKSLTGAMPKIASPVDGSTSTTYYIPIAYRNGTSINWIPHGITWTPGTTSPLGAIIVDGMEAYPQEFVNSPDKLKAALVNAAASGGKVILLTGSFGIDSSPSTSYYPMPAIPANTKILGRGKSTVITLSNQAQFVLSENCELSDFQIKTASNFSGNAVHMLNSKRAKVRNMVIDLSLSPDTPAVTDIFNTTILSQINSNAVRAIVVQPDGKILVGGDFSNYGGFPGRSSLVRLNSDGSVDTAFCNAAVDNKLNGTIHSIALLSDGSILAGGYFLNYGGTVNRNHLVKFSSAGVVDATFMSAVVDSNKINGQVLSVVVQPDGKILFGGDFTNFAGTINRNFLVRVSNTGVVDALFCNAVSDGNKFGGTVGAIALMSDNSIVVGGNFIGYVTPNRNYLVKFSSAGVLDTTFCGNASDGGKFNGNVYEIAIQSDNKVLIGGDFTNYNGTVGRNKFIRLDSTGTVDALFCSAASDGNKFFWVGPDAIKVQSDGKILLGGGFYNYVVGGNNYLARLNTDGSLDTGFMANASSGSKLNSNATCFAIQSDSKILIGGNFTNYINANRNRIAKVNSDGILSQSTPAVNVTGVRVEANNCRIYESWFIGAVSAIQRTAINYVTGYADNADVDSLFE